MRLDHFEVLHLPKPGLLDLPGVFVVETCQRSVAFGKALPKIPGACFLKGREAYAWALRFTTGLLSRIPGEPDVFGQFRSQWATFAGSRESLQQWVHALNEDTKWVRSQFLQSLGQQSYGQGFRKWRERESLVNLPGLILGAGDLAESCLATIGPDEPVSVWNRGEPRLHALQTKWSSKKPRAQFYFADCSWKEAISKAEWALIALPSDKSRFESLIEGSRVGPVLNLGSFATWGDNRVCALEGFFGMRGCVEGEALVKIRRAEKACRERALLRHLDRHVGLAHGWEDLVGFSGLDALI